MTSVKALISAAKAHPHQTSNYGVDYVIKYQIPPDEKAKAEADYVQLIETLMKVGLATEVRPGDQTSLLIFVKAASEKLLQAQVYRARLQDWLYGVRASAPGKDMKKCFEEEPITEAERLRVIYFMITKPKSEGGAGIGPGTKRWKNVESVFPLHDVDFNRTLMMRDWTKKLFLEEQDIEDIRLRFGEQIAFYFAFMQSYFWFLVFPAIFGTSAWLLFGNLHHVYGFGITLWSMVFYEYWKHKQQDMAVQWGVRGVSQIQNPRPQFQFEREKQDPTTGEVVQYFPPLKRFGRQLWQMPFALASTVALGGLYVACFALEIFIKEVYPGPWKQWLAFLPTIILSVLIPVISTHLTDFAELLTEHENYETIDSHKAAQVQKIFVLNFITSYIPLFLTAFVYVPFGRLLVPYLDIFQSTSGDEKAVSARVYQMDHDRLSNQVIFFTVTAQVINFATELILPWAKQRAARLYQDVKNDRAVKSGKGGFKPNDAPEEHEFLTRVRHEAELADYDVTLDYREMVLQFGYLSLFTVVWPVAALSMLINNWVEIRSDAVKIAVSCKRPIPWRSESIGPWVSSLGFLSWFGSITTSALLFLYHRDPAVGPAGVPDSIATVPLLLTILSAEHAYLVVQFAVRFVVARVLDTPGMRREKAERFAMRKTLLLDTLGHDAAERALSPVSSSGVEGGVPAEKITRQALEDEARRASQLGNSSPEERFWQRQRSIAETVTVGRRMIESMESDKNETKKSS